MKKCGTGLIFYALMMFLQSGNALGQTHNVVIMKGLELFE